MDIIIRPPGNPAGVVGTLTVQRLEWTRKLDSIGRLSATVPANDPGMAAILASTAQWLEIDAPGFWGVISGITLQRTPSGDVYQVEAAEALHLLTWRTLGYRSYTGITVASALTSLLEGWTWTKINGTPDVNTLTAYMLGNGNSWWDALLRLARLSGLRVVQTGPRAVGLMGDTRASWAAVTPAQNGTPDLSAGQTALMSAQQMRTDSNITTILVPFGAGNGFAQVNLQAATASLPSGYTYLDVVYATQSRGKVRGIVRTASQTAYGDRWAWVQFPDIMPIYNTDTDVAAAANKLQEAAVLYLQQHAGPVQTWALEVALASGWIEPGDAITSVGGAATTLAVIEVAATWDSDGVGRFRLQTADNVLASMATGADQAVTLLQAGAAYRVQPQLSANIHTVSSTKRLDAVTPARFPFRLDDAITQIRRLLFEFAVTPLESSTRPEVEGTLDIDASENHTHDINFTGHSHWVGQHTHPISGTLAHTHNVQLAKVGQVAGDAAGTVNARHNNITPVLAYTQNDTNAPATLNAPTTSTGNSTLSTDQNTANVTSTSSGLIASITTRVDGAYASDGVHTHTGMATLLTSYGLFRDDPGNVFGLDELQYRLNGGTWTSLAGATSVSNGWYRVDLTSSIVNSETLLPTGRNHAIEVRATAEGAYTNYVWVAAYWGVGQGYEIRKYDDDMTQLETVAYPTGVTACDMFAVSSTGTMWFAQGGRLYRRPVGGSWSAIKVNGVDVTTIIRAALDRTTNIIWGMVNVTTQERLFRVSDDGVMVTYNYSRSSGTTASVAAYAGYIFVASKLAGTNGAIYRINSGIRRLWVWSTYWAGNGTTWEQLATGASAVALSALDTQTGSIRYNVTVANATATTGAGVVGGLSLDESGLLHHFGTGTPTTVRRADSSGAIVWTGASTPWSGTPHALWGQAEVATNKRAQIEAQISISSYVQAMVPVA